MEEQFDIVGMLPPEIADLILALLPANDLWSCLSVSKRWRELSNSKKYWDRHLFAIDEEPVYEDIEDRNVDELCPSALQWSYVQMVIKHWRLNEFKEFPFPDKLQSPVFYSYEDHVAVLDRLDIKTFKVENSGLICSSEISLPSCLDRKHIIKNGVLVMNKHFLVYKNKIFLIVYRRAKSLILSSVFMFRISGEIDVIIGNELSEDLFLFSNYGRPCCVFSYLFEDKLWVSYNIDFSNQFHFLINLNKTEVKKIKLPIDNQVLNFKGIKHRILLELESHIIVYDTDGEILFFKDVGKDCICTSANENVIVLLNSKFIQSYDILSGKELLQITNEYYLPQLCVSPVADVVFVAKKYVNNFEISAYNVRGKAGVPLWTNNIYFINRVVCNGNSFFYGIFLFIFVDTITYDKLINKINFIDSRTGKTIIEAEFSDELFHFSKHFFIKEIGSRYVLYKA